MSAIMVFFGIDVSPAGLMFAPCWCTSTLEDLSLLKHQPEVLGVRRPSLDENAGKRALGADLLLAETLPKGPGHEVSRDEI
jgi:hypothetical protein